MDVSTGRSAGAVRRRVAAVADLRLLGPLEVVDDSGEPIKLSGARQRGLLALLGLSSPAMVSTDVIIEALWGADGIARPDAALHTTVNRLRKELGEAQVATEPAGTGSTSRRRTPM